MRKDVYAFEALWRAYRECRRNKRTTANALRFEVNAEANLLALREELRAHTYRPGRSICFVTDGPKPREVFAADFRDRIVHHLLVGRLQGTFEPRFIHDSFACRPGKGTLAASDRLMQFLRRATANGRRPAWVLKLDVAGFFPSIHKETLFGLLARHVRDPEVRWLTRVLLFHDPTTDFHFKAGPGRVPGPLSGRYPVPARKSLFGGDNARGLPIGNLTSQFWANVYLDEIDQFVKRTLGCRHYVRYVDDMVLVGDDPAQLRGWREAIRAQLRTALRLELRTDGDEPFPVQDGVTFVGWTTWWNRRVPRRQTIVNLHARLDGFARAALRRRLGGTARSVALVGSVPARVGAPRRARCARVTLLRAVLASYSGHLRHGAAGLLWVRAWERYDWLLLVFRRGGWRLTERWAVRGGVASDDFRRWYRRLAQAAGTDSLLFVQVGRYIELYGPQRLMAQRVLGLRPIWRPRAGYALTVGFPVSLLRRFVGRALAAGYVVVQVAQTKDAIGGAVTRRTTCIWHPLLAPAGASRRALGDVPSPESRVPSHKSQQPVEKGIPLALRRAQGERNAL